MAFLLKSGYTMYGAPSICLNCYDAATNLAWVHWHNNTDKARAGNPISNLELEQSGGVRNLIQFP